MNIETLNFISVIKGNILELKIDNNKNMIGHYQPQKWDKLIHSPNNLINKIEGLEIYGNINFDISFVNKKGLNSCYIYRSSILGDKLFGFSNKYISNTKFKLFNGSCNNYQNTNSFIKIINKNKKPITLELYGGSFILGKNKQNYLIDNLSKSKFNLDAVPFCNKIKFISVKSTTIIISEAIKNPYKFKNSYRIAIDCNVENIYIRIESNYIKNNILYDNLYNIAYHIEYNNNILYFKNNSIFFKLKPGLDLINFIPICNTNTKIFKSILILNIYSTLLKKV